MVEGVGWGGVGHGVHMHCTGSHHASTYLSHDTREGRHHILLLQGRDQLLGLLQERTLVQVAVNLTQGQAEVATCGECTWWWWSSVWGAGEVR
jgi:hypothetical protein